MILLVDWDKGEHQHKFKDDSSGMAWGVRFHPAGFIIGVGAPQGGNKGMLWFWKPGEEKAFHTVTLSHCGRGLDLTPDATRLAVARGTRSRSRGLPAAGGGGARQPTEAA